MYSGSRSVCGLYNICKTRALKFKFLVFIGVQCTIVLYFRPNKLDFQFCISQFLNLGVGRLSFFIIHYST